MKLVKVCYPSTIDGDDGEQCVYWPRSLRDAARFKSDPLPDDESPF